jgi:hypothetical protein
MASTAPPMASSPLFLLSLELRNQIYEIVITCEQPIHVICPRYSDRSTWSFYQCPQVQLDQNRRCACRDHKPNQEALDTALLSVSKQIQSEASIILFSRNHVRFDIGSGFLFRRFARTFGPCIKYIKEMTVFFYVRRRCSSSPRPTRTQGNGH